MRETQQIESNDVSANQSFGNLISAYNNVAKFAEIKVRKQDGCRERNWKGNEEVERGILVGWGWGGITRVKSGWGWKYRKMGKIRR